MRRVHFVYMTLILVTAVVGAGLVHLLRDPVTWANFRKIETGMTKEQVHCLLGGAHDHFAATDVHQPAGATADRVSIWFGNQGSIEVGFDEHGLVNWKRFTAGARHHGRYGTRGG